MRPVEQTLADNCFDACLASVLELPLDASPHYKGNGNWIEHYNAWLGTHGFRLVMLPEDEPAPKGYHLAAHRSPRGAHLHSVVVLDGEVVWDPHPERHMGLGERVRWDVLEPVIASHAIPPAAEGGST
jgi:hypothetical protein